MRPNTLAKNLSNHMSRTLATIFTNRASFSQELWDEFSKIMKSQKISWPCGLGPRNYIWAIWAQKTYQICPHSLKNHEMNPIKSWNLKKYLDLRVWGLETTFGPLGPKKRIKPYVQNNSYNYSKQNLIFSRIMRWIQ